MRLTMFFLLFAYLVSPTLSFAHGGSHGAYQRSSSHHSTGPNYGGPPYRQSRRPLHGRQWLIASWWSLCESEDGKSLRSPQVRPSISIRRLSFVTFKGGDFAKPAN